MRKGHAGDTADLPPGLRHLPGHLDAGARRLLLAEVMARVERAGWFRPVMPKSGRPFSVRMCNLGPLGWVSDRRGYRYTSLHPDSGRPWPPIPAPLLELWTELAAYPHPPECCLVNHYRPGARLGLHQDRDEEELAAPILSVSLGCAAWFRIGGLRRRDPTRRLLLEPGDVLIMGGPSRLIYHGIDRILPGTGEPVPGEGRINLTLRRVTRPAPAQSSPPRRWSVE